jgi:hypothetical protein
MVWWPRRIATLRLSLRACGGTAASLCLFGLVGCGAGGNGTSSASPSAAIDDCLVGSWVSSAVSASANGQPVQVTGGSGERLTINADGTVNIDDSDATVMDISAGGQVAHVKQSGQGTGKLATRNGSKVTLTLDSGSSLVTEQVDAGGGVVGTPAAAPTTVDGTYQCTAGQELKLTSSQSDGTQTVTYTPAGGSGSSSETGGSSSQGGGTGTESSGSSSTNTNTETTSSSSTTSS